jgi:glycosyltransferase involved in cell wall biosynthesis
VKIAIDITVLEQQLSGIARIILGLYSACIRVDPTVKIMGIHRNSLKCTLPSYFRDVQWCGWLPSRVWRRLGPSWYVRCRKPDVIHFPWNSGFVHPHKDCLRVLTIHDVIPLVLPEIHFKTDKAQQHYRRRMRDSLDNADVVITVSEASKHDIIKYLKPRSEPIVIYPGRTFSNAVQQDDTQSEERDNYYIYQGGYHPRKGLPELVRVYRDLYRHKHVKYPLILVGEPNHNIANGFDCDIEAGIREGALVEKGYVTDDELLRLMKGAIALIYPSLYEGFGLPLLEAMSVGCPVISSNAGSMPEVCGDAAIYVNPRSQDEIAEAIKKMGSRNDLRIALRERGFAQSRKFSWERSARSYLEVLGKALGTDNQGSSALSRRGEMRCGVQPAGGDW